MSGKQNKKLVELPKAVPKAEEAVKIIKECLKAAGVDHESFDILASPYCLIAPGLISSGTDQYLPCYVAVSRANGMAFFFPRLGPYGVYQRHKDKIRINYGEGNEAIWASSWYPYRNRQTSKGSL